ncbi:putative polyketide synthase [Xylariales sp. AK1849]|nr:putative polyketide synthase [Xylariales sp. AK1849]
MDGLSEVDSTPIAIIGMSCRFPADATSPERLWQMVANAQEAWSKWPADRFNSDAFYHPNPERGGTFNTLGGHFLNQNMADFDATFFSITPTEAKALDPQQRLQLESVYEALENAGIPIEQVCGTKTGVFIGTSNHDYEHMLLRDPDSLPIYHAVGVSASIMANRISYFFDLRGPSVTVDTACSSSLVALHQACQSLRLGESKTAIVGGANLILEPGMLIPMSTLKFFSPEGKCYTYDHRASGYGRGEGVGTVILKPLRDALRDGDTIRCVIRSTGVNSDGRTAGLMLPNGGAQEALIRSTYGEAGLDPGLTRYVESHGTGTRAGDPIESSALGRVFGAASMRLGTPPVRVGSIKTNIGHLENASGIAGLIKSVLSVEKGLIPPNSNFEKAGDRISLGEENLQVPTQLEPWPVPGLRRASINSFGFGGTNAHCIIDDAASYLKEGHLHGHTLDTTALGDNSAQRTEATNMMARTLLPRLFVLSANDEHSLKSLNSAYAAHLNVTAPKDEITYMERLAYTLYSRRSLLPWRQVVIASSLAELSENLSAQATVASRPSTPPRLGFVFNGQGAHWPRMGLELMKTYKAFEASIRNADKHLRSLGAEWSLVEELSSTSKPVRTSLASFDQPACTAVQIALVDLLSSWGVTPRAVVGHSSGEIAAAYAAGYLTLKSAVSIAYYRGLAVTTLHEVVPDLRGAMLATALSATAARTIMKEIKTGELSIGCINSPSSVTISGDSEAIDEMAQILEERRIFARKLRVDVAYHSPHMLYVSNDYLVNLLSQTSLPDFSEENQGIIFASSLAGRLAKPHELGATYWLRNLLSTVKFSEALSSMVSGDRAGSIDTLVEIGPHSTLAGPIKQTLASLQVDQQMKYLPTLIRNEHGALNMMHTVRGLWRQGCPVNINQVNCINHPESRYGPLIDLPPYPFNHTIKHWHESRLSKDYRFRKQGRHDLLGAIVPESNTIEPRWRNILRVSEVPWLKDHNVQNSVVFPATGFIAMAIEAERQKLAMANNCHDMARAIRLRNICLSSALVLPAGDDGVETSLSLRPLPEGDMESSIVWSEFRIFSHADTRGWVEHCRGNIAMHSNSQCSGDEGKLDTQTYWHTKLSAEFAGCTRLLAAATMYEVFESMGLLFGPTFRNLDNILLGSRHCSKSDILMPHTEATMPYRKESDYIIHPCVLDSCFQAAFPCLIQGKKMKDPMVPTFIEQLVIKVDSPPDLAVDLEAYASAKPSILRSYISDIAVFDKTRATTPEPVILITGMKTTSLSWSSVDTSRTKPTRKICYTMPWGPDVDVMNQVQMSKLLPISAPAQEIDNADSLTILEWLSHQYLTEALFQIRDQDRDTMAKHHRQLYDWAKLQTAPTIAITTQNVAFPLAYTVMSQPDSAAKKKAAIEIAQNLGAQGNIVVRIGENLVPILKGEVNPLALMMQDNLLTDVYTQDKSMLRCYELLRKYSSLLSFKKPNLRILEIGAGTGGATEPLLEALGGGGTERYPRFCQYTYTDVSSAFFEKARARFADWEDVIEYRTLDIEKDTTEQGFQDGTYDLIIAANVLHATRNVDATVSHVRKLLKPGGRLIMIEITEPRLRICLPFGTLPGWWLGEGDGRQTGPLLNPSKWDDVLKRNGFGGLDVCEADYPAPYEMSSFIVSRAREYRPKAPRLVSVVSSASTSAFTKEVTRQLSMDHSWRSRSYSHSQLSAADPGLCVLLDFEVDPPLTKLDHDKFAAMKAFLSRAGGVLWVTSGAHDKSPDTALVTGLARTLRNENAGLKLVTLDLDPETIQDSSESAGSILRVLNSRFGCVSYSSDTEFVERDGQIKIPRLAEYTDLNDLLGSDLTDTPRHPHLEPFQQLNRPLRLEVGTPGLIDSLQFADHPNFSGLLGPDSVEFKVKAIGLNFRDVLTVLGQIENPYPLGYDCSGIITAVGINVKGFSIGDNVAALAVGSFSSVHRVKAHNVFRLPAGMSLEDGASIPLAFATAYHALVDVAKVSKGQRILVHSAAGGVGQAAVKLAQLTDAEVFVTVGNDNKRQLMMHEYGIPHDHIFSSRDNGFADQILRMTEGEGIDVVLNQLSGELLKETWRCIAMFGCFLEIGKRDIYANSRLEMRPFDKHVTFSAIDLSAVFTHRPQLGARILRDCFALFDEGKLSVVKPIATFPIDQVQMAFRFMQAGKHSGKIVVTVPDNAEVMVAPPQDAKLFGPYATYVIAGGAGGLGREICQWMVDNGARNILLLSRNGTDANRKVQELVDKCSASGATVKVCKCDARIAKDVAHAHLEARKMLMPPIRGVINGAMILRDSLFEDMSFDDWKAVTDTKLLSSWNLHKQLLYAPLDFFILLSSAAGISGNRGQANYAASSTFQDAFARFRHSLGLPATSLDLGMIDSAGYVADNQDSVSYLKSHGYSTIKLEELFSMLRHAILTGSDASQEHRQIICGYDATAAKHASAGSSASGVGLADPKFSHLPQIHLPHVNRGVQNVDKQQKAPLRHVLLAAEPEMQLVILVKAVVSRLASLLGKESVDINENKSIASLGVDSLVAVEFRNWVVGETGVSLPIFEILGADSISELASKIEQGCVFLKNDVIGAENEVS